MVGVAAQVEAQSTPKTSTELQIEVAIFKIWQKLLKVEAGNVS